MTEYKSGFNTINVDTTTGVLHIENHKPKERKGTYTIPIGAIESLSKNIAYSAMLVGVMIHPINDVKHPPKLFIKGDRYTMMLSRKDAKKFRQEVEAAIPKFKDSTPDWEPFPQHEDLAVVTDFRGEMKKAFTESKEGWDEIKEEMAANKREITEMDEALARAKEQSLQEKATSGMPDQDLGGDLTDAKQAIEELRNLPKIKPPSKQQSGGFLDKLAAFEVTYRFGGIKLKGKTITYQGESLPVAGARATIDAGQLGSRMTATRVVGGAVLFGPVGALLGGLAKKKTGDAFLNIELADGRFIIEHVKRKDLKEANRFVKEVNDAAFHA